MQRFAAKYTDAQREAVIRAMVDEHRTASATVRAAADGELGTPPFDIPLTTAYWLARRERQRREREIEEALLNGETLEDMVERVTRTLLEILRMEAERVLFAYEQEEPELQRLRWLIRQDRELRKMIPTEFDYRGLSELDHLTRRLTKNVT